LADGQAPSGVTGLRIQAKLAFKPWA
jgi:hypothetical protein